MAHQTDIAILGGGAAGIAAARALMAAGRDCLIIEARHRLGGRAHTARRGGYALDMGCAWLHSAESNPFSALAAPLGFTLDLSLPPWQRGLAEAEQKGHRLAAFREEQAAFFERLAAGGDDDTGDDQPCAAYLDPKGKWSALLNAVSSYISGAELEHVSARDFRAYHDTEMNWRVREGFGALIARFGRGAPRVLNCPVSRIDHSGKRIKVQTVQGVISCKAVIVCLPTNVLAQEKIIFHPALPGKVEAAAGLPLGVANKIFLLAKSARDLPRDGWFFGRTNTAATGAYHTRPFGRPMIEGYFGGACAREMERLGPAGFAAFAMDELCGLLGAQWRKRLSLLTSTGWAGDEYALGSYSHALPGQAHQRAVLAAPVDARLFFAGEATAPHYFSTAHGAHESGLRAAWEVINAQ